MWLQAYLLLRQGVSTDDLEKLLKKESGLKGMSGLSGDTRVLLPAATRGDDVLRTSIGSAPAVSLNIARRLLMTLRASCTRSAVSPTWLINCSMSCSRFSEMRCSPSRRSSLRFRRRLIKASSYYLPGVVLRYESLICSARHGIRGRSARLRGI